MLLFFFQPRRGHEDEHPTARARWTLAVAVPRAAMHAVPPVVAATATAGVGTTGVLGAGGGAPGGPQDGPQRSRPFIQQASHSEDGMAAHNTVKFAAAAARRPHSATRRVERDLRWEESTEHIAAFLTPLLYRLCTTHYALHASPSRTSINVCTLLSPGHETTYSFTREVKGGKVGGGRINY